MATKTEAEPTAADAAPGGKKKKIMMIAPVLVLVLAGVGFFFLKPSGAPEKKPAPVPGAILQLEPQSVNLAGGHFLKLGFALQATKAAGEELDGAKALDIAIDTFSGRTIEELATREGREKAKKLLTKEIVEAYEGKVYQVYLTTFVMQ